LITTLTNPYIALGLILCAVSLPLILGRIKPNRIYGFRIPTTLNDPQVWYPANAYAGRWLLVIGALFTLAATLARFIPGITPDRYAILMAALILGGLLLAFWFSWIFARRLASLAFPADFCEEQRFDQLWVWVLIYGLTAYIWYTFAQQMLFGNPIGNNPASDWFISLYWVLFGLGMPAFIFGLRLVVAVHPGGVRIEYLPLLRREIPFEQIERAAARRYHPIREYGGWGIRGLPFMKCIAYSTSGSQGVELLLKDGRLVLLGSQDADALAAAIIRNRNLDMV
jgi:hypothetical protein